jgi:apolipoprotein N-acyltransferase
VTGTLLRILAAAVSGLLMALSFPPYGLWPLAAIAVAGLTLTVAGQKAGAGFGYGLISGLAFFGVLVQWISVIGNDAWAGLIIYSTPWFGLVGWGSAIVMRLPGWPIWIAVIWTATEALRDRFPLGGWPWGRLGFSQSESPMLALAWLGGAPLLTAAVALLGGLLAGSWVAWRAGRLDHAIAALGVAVAVVLVGLIIPLPSVGESIDGPAEATIAMVQGDVPETGLGFNDQRRAVLDNHVSQTLQLADQVDAGEEPQPDAVIWPENASDIDPYTNSDAYAAIGAAATAIAAPILVGAVVENPADPKTVLNLGIVWDPETGPGERYVKQHPVPFGEYIPLRDQLADVIGKFDRIPRDFAAGDTTGVLQVGPVRMGDIICFEVAYDDLVRETVKDGGRMIAVQTNNATYTGSGQTEQQLAMARIRSVEHSRTVAVVATNGISALFLPDGREVARMGESTAGTIVAKVPLRDSTSPSARLGWLPEAVALLAAVALIVLGLRNERGLWPRGESSAAANARDESNVIGPRP